MCGGKVYRLSPVLLDKLDGAIDFLEKVLQTCNYQSINRLLLIMTYGTFSK